MLPKPTELKVNASTLRLSWTLSTLSLQDHQVYLPTTSYIIELAGGNCPANGSNVYKFEVTQHSNISNTSYYDEKLPSELLNQLHSGANYSLRIKGYHMNFTSNFSEPDRFTTIPKGEYIITFLDYNY